MEKLRGIEHVIQCAATVISRITVFHRFPVSLQHAGIHVENAGKELETFRARQFGQLVQRIRLVPVPVPVNELAKVFLERVLDRFDGRANLRQNICL